MIASNIGSHTPGILWTYLCQHIPKYTVTDVHQWYDDAISETGHLIFRLKRTDNFDISEMLISISLYAPFICGHNLILSDHIWRWNDKTLYPLKLFWKRPMEQSPHGTKYSVIVNSTPPGWNGHHFADDFFQMQFYEWKIKCFFIRISLIFAP